METISYAEDAVGSALMLDLALHLWALIAAPMDVGAQDGGVSSRDCGALVYVGVKDAISTLGIGQRNGRSGDYLQPQGPNYTSNLGKVGARVHGSVEGAGKHGPMRVYA